MPILLLFSISTCPNVTSFWLTTLNSWLTESRCSLFFSICLSSRIKSFISRSLYNGELINASISDFKSGSSLSMAIQTKPKGSFYCKTYNCYIIQDISIYLHEWLCYNFVDSLQTKKDITEFLKRWGKRKFSSPFVLRNV